MLKQDTIDRALKEIEKGYAQYQYFFDKLTSPAWLEPLSARGFFKNPPSEERVGEYSRFPFWPESRYLIRMSRVPEAQATVLKIALGIPSSENSRVYDDITDIALSLPPSLSAKLAPKVAEGVRLPIKLVLSEKIGNLIVLLAEGGEGTSAAALTRTALALSPDPRTEEKEEFRSLNPQSQFRDWYYAGIVDKAVPALARAIGLEAVRIFSDLLDDALRFSRGASENQDDEDYLYISYPALEEKPDRDDVRGILLNATREVAEQVIAADDTRFTAVLSILDSKTWVSFRRLKLHLCRIFPQQGIAIAEQVFQNPEILDQPSLRHEAALLLKTFFSAFTAESQKRLLEWIDQGQSEDAIRRWLEIVQEPATPENINQLADIWRRDHYAILQGQLPEPYKRKLEALIGARGEARLFEKPRRITGGAISAQSPKSVEELERMSADELVEFLRSWTPGSGMFEPTAEGLGQKLATVVAKTPETFATSSAKFQGLDPTYLRAFFSSLTSALKQSLPFDWEPVLALAQWVVTQPREIAGRKGGLMVADPDWGWTRGSIIDLLTAGLDESNTGCFAPVHRHLVWAVLQPLTEDPNPLPTDELGEKFDPAFLSINSTRGRAIHAVIRYARWVRLSTDAERKVQDLPPLTFEAMPEVREVLEGHLDVKTEPTLTIRSVYGDHLTLLAALDRDWVKQNIDRILPLGASDSAYFTAAWESFVCFNQPNTLLLPSLLDCYRQGITQRSSSKRGPRSPADALAEHLMVYYWLGALEFGGSDRLLDDFYAVATDERRGHAIWFIGTSVASWDVGAPSDVLARLQNLIVRRLEAAEKASSPESFSKELMNVGFWFTSEKFDERWSIETLLRAVKLSKKAEPEMGVVKRLAEICPKYPVECVAVLRLMIEGDREGWLLLGVEKDAQLVLRRALESANSEGSSSARRLVEELIARGQFGFRDLLA